MHNHSHSCTCEHEQVRYCKHCSTVYCLNCNQEWGSKYAWTWYYPQPSYYQSGYLQRLTGEGTAGNQVTTSSGNITVPCTHEKAL